MKKFNAFFLSRERFRVKKDKALLCLSSLGTVRGERQKTRKMRKRKSEEKQSSALSRVTVNTNGE
jgi:hypothetical protein